MYFLTSSYLPSQVVATLGDFIKNASGTNKYKSFKTAVIVATKPPGAKRFKAWLESTLGNRKPWDFLQYLQTLEIKPGKFFWGAIRWC